MKCLLYISLQFNEGLDCEVCIGEIYIRKWLKFKGSVTILFEIIYVDLFGASEGLFWF